MSARETSAPRPMGGPMRGTPEEFVQKAIDGGGTVSMPIAPLMHGAALWVGMMTVFGGNTLVLSSARKMDPHEIWSTVEREKVMSISLVGDAMARPLVEALEEPGASYDLSGFFVIGSGGAILSPAVKAHIAERLPSVMVIDSLGASETGYQGTNAGTDSEGRPRFAMGEHTTVLGDDNGIGGFEGSNEDFFPKTVVVAGEWRKTLFHFPWIFAAEIMDYQLKSSLFTPNPAFHTQAMRVGVECGIAEGTQLRLGSDRGDLSFGFGYAFPWHRRRPVQFDYALLLERGWTTFNPYAVGLKILF